MLITATPTRISLALAMRTMHRCESDRRWGRDSHTRAVRSNQTIVTEQLPQKHYRTGGRRWRRWVEAERREGWASREREGSRRRRQP
ncbi:hypothetical protein PAHAL_1G027500 [Panicum hallii]|uniref:Uncharacterized protein n=1 Tax=Panicum hallii TaxID=206008 RepID=A0A2T8KTT7_9POAL|nr:hypothetical protein PAHAL_1G027500 [Panicum hallii]